MLTTIFDYIPRILTAIIIIAIGVFIARLASKLLTQLLSSAGADAFATRFLGTANVIGKSFSLSAALGTLVQVLILLFFIVEGLNALQLEVLRNIGAQVIGYLPNVLAALGILILGWFLATLVDRLISTNVEKGGMIGTLAKVLVMVIAVFMVLNQLRIATTIVNYSFLFVVAGIAVAFALAFGLGGRDFARRNLEKLDAKIDDVKIQESAPLAKPEEAPRPTNNPTDVQL